MGYQSKAWEEKLMEDKGYTKFLTLEKNFPCNKALQKMEAVTGDSAVIAPPIDVYDVVNTIPENKLVTLAEICKKLAQKYNTQYCYTLTTEIYITIAGKAANEIDSDLLYWRTIKNNGALNPNYPGGIENHKALLTKAGHEFIKKGRTHIRYVIKDFVDRLVTFS